MLSEKPLLKSIAYKSYNFNARLMDALDLFLKCVLSSSVR
ncbi:hypothetical protein SynSYN20_01390 [Synechococcus sp. SYN20]|nr:hypothetical protein SynSYN20_01390 [Synechococcus sp. SYN20]